MNKIEHLKSPRWWKRINKELLYLPALSHFPFDVLLQDYSSLNNKSHQAGWKLWPKFAFSVGINNIFPNNNNWLKKLSNFLRQFLLSWRREKDFLPEMLKQMLILFCAHSISDQKLCERFSKKLCSISPVHYTTKDLWRGKLLGSIRFAPAPQKCRFN